jgi:hypothetical protein
MSPSQVLSRLADELVDELGPPHSARHDYSYPVFASDGSVTVRQLDAAVFTTPSPSVATALCALTTSNGQGGADRLAELGYFGGPLAIIDDDGSLTAYRFIAPRVPTKIESIESDEALPWVRRTLAREASAASQLELPLSEGRDVLITEARRGLSRLVSDLIDRFQDAGLESPAAAFDAAIRAIRSELFGEPIENQALVELVRPYRDALRFPHVPLEAVAELYETLGIEARDRRERGIAYTPAWIADHLVSRLPSTAFSVRPAVDPTCGSGTFLVAYLDRLVAERGRRRLYTGAEDLVGAVAGVDLDPVALATSRLTLDLFAQRLGYKTQEWALHAGDATSISIPCSVLLGNLPFGYRSHEGRDDISSVILRHWLADREETIESLAVLLPDSFAYAHGGTAKARAELRSRFRIDEVLELPEEVFERTSAATLAVVANKGEGGTPIVRDIRRRDLAAFRITGIPTQSFVTQLPPGLSDPWALTPFFNVLEKAEARAHAVLGDVAQIRLGFQAYGTEAKFDGPAASGPAILDDPSIFMAFAQAGSPQLRRLTSPPEILRRSGPVELYGDPKLIIRATTNRHQVARLAALPDEQGLWFSDKFIGIWPEGGAPPLLALAAYLQTAFCELWLATNNPSRKLRVGTLQRLPLPALPADWWNRATSLAQPARTSINPRWSGQPLTLLDNDAADVEEWRWFEHVVAVALGMTTAQLTSLEQYLADHLTVGRP